MTGGQLDLIDGQGLAEQANRQATVAELADAIRGEHESPNTTRAYVSDWRTWTAFCAVAVAGVRVDPLAVDPLTGKRDAFDDALVVYWRRLAHGGLLPDGGRIRAHAPESIRRRLNGVLHGWRERGIDYPREVSTSARRWVKGYEAKLIEHGQPTGRGQAPALEIHDAHRTASPRRPSPPSPAGATSRCCSWAWRSAPAPRSCRSSTSPTSPRANAAGCGCTSAAPRPGPAGRQ